MGRFGGANAGTDSGHDLVCRHPLRAACFHVRHAPGDFLAPGFGDVFGRLFGHAFQAYDQAMDEFAALPRRKLQGLCFKLFQGGCHDVLR